MVDKTTGEKTNRLNWADTDWALHLNVHADALPELRAWLDKNYSVQIIEKNGGFCVSINLPKKYKKWLPTFTHKKPAPTPKMAANIANSEFIPNIEINKLFAKDEGVPVKVLQLLRVKVK